MTDLERAKAFFVSLGYTEQPMTSGYHHRLKSREFYFDPTERTINFGDGGSKYGYSGFGFCLVFHEDGSFAGHGAFE